MYSLGLDIGSSSVKAALFDVARHRVLATATSPADELPILSPKAGWAEQDPEQWWHHVVMACGELRSRHPEAWSQVATIGIAYQMHGLVVLGVDGKPLRPSIIWCDSRAVEIGAELVSEHGKKGFLEKNSNTPGNFTLSKMLWMARNEPDIWSKVWKVMLPGDYIAYRLTGNLATTISGISEMAAWDFRNDDIDWEGIKNVDIKETVFPPVFENFGPHGKLAKEVADSLGLSPSVELRYRAGDQPNNAFGLGVTEPGSVAVNAGTSGVVYAVSDRPIPDPLETYNVFVHVNHSPEHPRNGMLLCLNGCGIVYAQLKRQFRASSYAEMNEAAATVSVGAEGLRVLPFGNGAERMLANRNPRAKVWGWDFNRHNQAHWYRAATEGVAASLAFGIERMRSLGIPIQTVKAGKANLFLNPVFVEAFVHMADVTLELSLTDGAMAAALAAASGPDVWKNGDLQANSGNVQHFRPTSAKHKFEEVKSEYFSAIEAIIQQKE